MPKAKAITSLSGMIDSEMEEDSQYSQVEMMPSPEHDSNQENAAPARKTRGRPKAPPNKVVKPKTASRRVSGGTVGTKRKAPVKKKAPVKRAPLSDQVNEQNADGTEEFDGFAERALDELEGPEAEPPAQAIRQPKKSNKTGAKGRKVTEKDSESQSRAIEKDGEFEYTPTTARQSQHAAKAPSIAKKPAVTKRQKAIESQTSQRAIPESQPLPMEIDQTELQDESVEMEEQIPESVYRQTNHAHMGSRQTQPTVVRRRGGSASDTERAGGDPATRRKLGEMTKKFENVELKYRNLRDLGLREAESNFEKLKKQSDDKTKAANDLIASLKKDLAAQKNLVADSRTIQKQLASKDAELAAFQAQQAQLSTSLSESQNENKALQAKISALRTASSSIESVNAKTPGSAMKGHSKGQPKLLMVGSAEAAQAAQIAQLKEDLYSDLTGLILRAVDRGEESDLYDCIQTGRNGTLHFKLAVANDNDGKGSSYEDTEFQYTPRLDANRDKDLLEILPDYLSEEITFSRLNAAKFYSRVVETLTRKRADDE